MLSGYKFVLVYPILVGALAACAVKPVTVVEHEPVEECVLLDAENTVARPVSIAITAQNAASPLLEPWEKFLRFTQRSLYETLISVDCRGRLRPGLAESWKSENQGTLWTFRLRGGARFSDGERVTAQRLAGNWQVAFDQDSRIDSIVAIEEHTVAVYVGRSSPAVPSVFSSPRFAASSSSADRSYTVGTGPYLQNYRNMDRLTGLLEPNPYAGNAGPAIEIIDARADDERDLFSQNIDLFMTSDPDVVAYANSLESYRSIALPWEKIYVLLSTTRVIEPGRIETDDPLPRQLTDRLATESLRTDSRGFESPPWWHSLQGCPSAEGRIPRRPRAFFYTSGFRQILFDENDDIARSLAGRIVALASEDADLNPDTEALLERIPGFQDNEIGLTAKAASRNILKQSLEGGDDFAYIIPLQVHPFDACGAWSELMLERIPWLPAGPNNLGIAVVPLVDVRPHIIARPGDFGLTVDGFGYMTFTRPESGR